MIDRTATLKAVAQGPLPFLVFMPVPLYDRQTLVTFASDLAVKHSQLEAAPVIRPGIEHPEPMET